MNTLATKLAAVTIEVGGKLTADKTNKEQNYEYLSSDKIISVCGQALATKGIVVIPEVTSQDILVYEYDKFGKPMRRWDAKVEFAFTVTDGETELKQCWQGCGSDYTTPDKALYKAITSGHKYFLMKLVCVGIGNEDSEHETEPEETVKAKTAKQTAGITLEDAKNVTNREGVKYGDLPTDKLSYMYNEVKKKQNLTEEQLFKVTAMKLLLDARSSGELPEPTPLVDAAAELGGVQA